MKRRRFLQTIGAATVAAPGFAAAAAAAGKPNILFIITDDQALDAFGFLRQKALTPNLDRLAAEGVYFSRGYVSSSVCTPSRYTCLTGRYANRAQSKNFLNSITSEGQTCVQWNVDLRPEDSSLPKALQKAGYVTGVVGKWHNGGAAGWGKARNELPRDGDPAEPKVAALLKKMQDDLHAHVKTCGFDYAASMNLGNFGAHPVRALRYHNQEWITKGAFDFIEANKDRPFYLYMAPTLLHGPSPLASLKADPRVTHGGLLDAPLEVQPSRESVLRRAKAAGVDERLAPATWLDDGLGAVLDKLETLGLAENTLVLFLNDHGVEQGKGSCYESGVRTPVIVRWKGRIKPGASDALIQNIDFAPTVLEACGVKPPADLPLDGESLWPLLSGKADKVHDSLYFEIGYTRAVRTDRWKYLAFRIPPSKQLSPEQRRRVSERYAEMKTDREDQEFVATPDAPLSHMGFPGGQSTERGNAVKLYAKSYYDADQLYDLKNDPDEQINLAKSPAHRQNLERMQALLVEHLAKTPGTFAEFKPKRG